MTSLLPGSLLPYEIAEIARPRSPLSRSLSVFLLSLPPLSKLNLSLVL